VTEPAGVNLRGGPGTDYDSLGVIPKGTELPVMGPKANGDWLPVTYQGKLGFVFDEYVEVKAGAATQPGQLAPGALQATPLVATTPAPPVQSAPAPTPPPGTAQLRVNSPEGLNLRAGPGTEHAIVTVIAHNSLVTPIQRAADGRWVQVLHNGQAGWVDGLYLVSLDQPVSTTDSSRTDPGTAAGSARYIWPVAGRSITTPFSPGHLGIDVDQFNAEGSPVVAAAAGKVSFAGGNRCCSYGLYVQVEHRDGSMTLYAHLSVIQVHEGQDVAQGQVVGLSGNTGRSTGAHLHFELHMSGSPVDPLLYLSSASAPRSSASPSPTPSPSGSPSPAGSTAPSAIPAPPLAPSPSPR
jgi:murein DD-endopeptidase MepM/ murein hydrolase activator NlpD